MGYAIILPLIFTLVWLIKNTQLPTADATDYLSSAMNMYDHFTTHGFWNGIGSLLHVRGFRPVFFPVLAVPFLLVSHGNLFFTYNAIALVCLAASLIYIYLLLRLELDNLTAIITTNIVGLLPVVQAQLLGFYAESALLPCIIGFIYHLIKSDYFRNSRQTSAASLLLTAAIILRPVEAVMNVIFLLAAFFIVSWYKKIFTLRQILIVATIFVSSLFIFISACAVTYAHSNMIALDPQMGKLLTQLANMTATITLSMWLLVITQYSRTFASQITLIPAFAIICLLILIWYYPYAFETFQWVYRTSIGDIAAATGTGSHALISPQHSFCDELINQIHAEGAVLVLGVILLAAANFLVLLKQQRLRELFSLPLLYLLTLTPVSFFEVFFTVQDWPRKLSVAFPALLMILLIIALKRSRLSRFSIVAATFLLLIQFTMLAWTVFLKPAFNPTLDKLIAYHTPHPVVTNPNPHTIVENFLNEQAQKYHLKNIGLMINPNTLEPVDPFLLSMMVQLSHQHYTAGYAFFSTYSPENKNKLTENFDAILLSTTAEKMQVSPVAADMFAKKFKEEKNPSIKMMYEFLLNYSKGQLTALGWKQGPCITIKSACLIEPVTLAKREANCYACILLHRA